MDSKDGESTRATSEVEKIPFEPISNAKAIVGVNDEEELARMGYKQEFSREFTNLGTISFAFSICGVGFGVTSAFNTPFLLGGPASVMWCWIIGSIFCACIAASVAEIISAYPTNGGMYSASAYLLPGRKYRAIGGWSIGWLSLLGQASAFASVNYAAAGVIFVLVTVTTDGAYVASNGAFYGLTAGLAVLQGVVNSLSSKHLNKITSFFIFWQVGTVIAIVVALLVTTKEKHSVSYLFTATTNGSGWSSNGISFLLGLLQVSWTLTDYDAAAHISEEIRRASVAAPVAIMMAIIGSSILGLLLNGVLVACSGPYEDLLDGGPTGYVAGSIILNSVGKPGFIALWICILVIALMVNTAILASASRTFFAFSRDNGMPDRRFFARLSKNKVPINAVWLLVAISCILCLLLFASVIAVNAILAVCSIALDTSYLLPIAFKLLFRDHPEVKFRPGPFSLGRGWFGTAINLMALGWITFVLVVLSLPTQMPVTKDNMNYCSVVLLGTLILSTAAWFGGGSKIYTGPLNLLEGKC
ncbi:amino acid transporter [Meredithblackwellia eburnea MCA 4105]